uniref:Uncharacterized protein n=1 Tax=Phyllostachys edulis TaxID=38705 RepID=D3IVD6_PHYED|nr:hypothetical protein [Phyllostachys edulis]
MGGREPQITDLTAQTSQENNTHAPGRSRGPGPPNHAHARGEGEVVAVDGRSNGPQHGREVRNGPDLKGRSSTKLPGAPEEGEEQGRTLWPLDKTSGRSWPSDPSFEPLRFKWLGGGPSHMIKDGERSKGGKGKGGHGLRFLIQRLCLNKAGGPCCEVFQRRSWPLDVNPTATTSSGMSKWFNSEGRSGPWILNPRAKTSRRWEDLTEYVEEEVVAVGFDPTATTSTRWDDLAAMV